MELQQKRAFLTTVVGVGEGDFLTMLPNRRGSSGRARRDAAQPDSVRRAVVPGAGQHVCEQLCSGKRKGAGFPSFFQALECMSRSTQLGQSTRQYATRGVPNLGQSR